MPRRSLTLVPLLLLLLGGLTFSLQSGPQPPAYAAATPCYDPVPSPAPAGWQSEGDETFVEATPLVITDTTAVASPTIPLPFKNFFCPADAIFLNEIILSTEVLVDVGYVPDVDGNTGVHLTINDGLREIRAVVLQSASSTRVAIVTQVGLSPGIDLGGAGGQFTLRRLTDGSAVLEARGATETIAATDLPGSRRPGVKTLEFGIYNVPTLSVTRWLTLGLPQLPAASPTPTGEVQPA